MLDEQPDFDIGKIPTPQNRYLAWIDVMGTAAISARSLSEASIKVFKLHIASHAAYESCDGPKKQQLDIYPMIDGIYVLSSSKNALLEYLQSTFIALGTDIVDAEEIFHVLAVKASVAYGPVIQGEQLGDYNEVLAGTESQERTMVGLPIVQSFLSESEAPPFGVFIHESARAFAPDGDDPFNFVWWKWFESNKKKYDNTDLARDIRDTLNDYYEWAKSNSERINYSENKIEEHKQLVNQYLPSDD